MARWHSCNILHLAADAKRLWRFEAKSGGFVLSREQRVPHAEPLPEKYVAKNWTSLWQPKLNVAWLSPEEVFLRVIELPASNFDETLAMVELQLEKLSPLPVAQAVWTMQVVGTYTAPPNGDAVPENLQTVVVVIAARSAVEEFAGRLERDGYLADRLETPMLDQLEAVATSEDGVWLFPFSASALVAVRSGGALRNLSFVTLPVAGDRAKELNEQLAHIAWAGELEGWLTASLKWHLVADAATAADWEPVLRTALDEPVQTIAPTAPAELAARTAKRATATNGANLLPPEFAVRNQQRLVDRLWMRGLFFVGAAYAVGLVIYFCATTVLGYRVTSLERQVAASNGSYTNSLHLNGVYHVLSEREKLKYAALDCWKWVAEELPPTITLNRFSFADGEHLTLSGTAPAAQINTLFDFNTALKEKKVNGHYVFDQNTGETVNPKENHNTETWNLSVDLLHSEADLK